ncbi:MAG TPA: LuxR C-terminal-related transcriptional regulator [Gallionella sp.]|nr:LuxR C-terminal-related transcriptional regulator [Gallionella sp.]
MEPEQVAGMTETPFSATVNLKFLGQCKSVNEIAEELLLNNRTVSTYKARLMQKMNFKNNAELVLYASESGLI